MNKSFTSMFDLGPLSGPECPGTSRQTAPDASSGVLPIARWHHVAGYGTRPDPQAAPLQCWSFLVPVNENIILMIFDILRSFLIQTIKVRTGKEHKSNKFFH